jgi:hypothetical protein
MSCCGQKRAQQRANGFSAVAVDGGSNAAEFRLAAPRASSTRLPMGSVYFEYTGASNAVTVVGGATGRQYRFTIPGQPVEVDSRDRWSLAAVPGFREIQ